jgi:hypothetical protein
VVKQKHIDRRRMSIIGMLGARTDNRREFDAKSSGRTRQNLNGKAGVRRVNKATRYRKSLNHTGSNTPGFLKRGTNLKPSDRILDVGCGGHKCF